eukprot:scaffold81715_cov29-Cyclotella_meneghiniana.AAC.3
MDEEGSEGDEEPTGFKGVDPNKLLEVALAKVNEFKTANETDVSYQALGLDSVSHLIRFLVSVSRGFIPEIVLEMDDEDEVLKAYEVSQHQSFILPPLDDPNRLTRLESRFESFQSQSIQLNHTLGKIGDVLQTSNELTSKRIEISESKMEKDKDRTHKYHPSVINCLKNLASIDGVEQADSPADSILRVLNCESHSKAELELLSQYNDKKVSVTFSIGTSKAIYDGKFTWSSHEIPSCVSPFSIGYAKPNDTSMVDRHLMLGTLESHGKSMTAEEIKKSLKQALTIPESYHEVIDQVRVFRSTLEILGGTDCSVAYAIKELSDFLEERRGKIDSLMSKNKEVGAHILYHVGLKVNNYIDMAHRASSPEDIPKSVLDFSNLRESIDSFNVIPNLPTTFKHTATEPTDDSSTKPGKKRGSKDGKEERRKLVRNSDPVEEWKLQEGEKWEMFCGENCKDRPTWLDGKRMCHKWHIKGVCFSDCPYAASHVPKPQVPPEKKRAFGDWRKKKAGRE